MKAMKWLLSLGLLMSTLVLQAQNNLSRFNYAVGQNVFVNTVNLNLFHQRKDYDLKGLGDGLDFTFYYNSANRGRDDGYGEGWSFTYNQSYEIDNSGSSPIFHLHREDGCIDAFEWNGSSWDAPKGVFDLLEEYATDQYRLTDKHGQRYFFDDATHQGLTSIVDRNGNTTTVTYSSNLPTSVTDASGRSITLTFTNGHLTELRNATVNPNHVITYAYDGNDRLVTHVDPMGNTTRYTYDSAGGMSGIEPPAGGNMSITHNGCKTSSVSSSKNQHTFIENPGQKELLIIEGLTTKRERVYQKDTCERIVAIRNKGCCGGGIQLEYDGQNNIVKHTDAKGNATTYGYDSKGNNTSQTNPLGQSNATTFDPIYNFPLTYTDAKGNTTTYAYDANGNLLSETFPLGVVQTYTYDGNGNRLTSTDGNGHTTTATYDGNGYRSTLTNPLGHTFTYTYDGLGNVTRVTDPAGNSTNYEYDANENLVKRTDAASNETNFTYDHFGNTTSITDPDGRTTTFGYDNFGRRTLTTNPDGSQRSWTYDERDLIITTTDPNGHTSNMEYDGMDRLVREVDPLGNALQYGYDANGNRTSDTDANGQTTTYTYDALDRILTVTDPNGGTNSFTYDANGNQTTRTDANGQTTTNIYDILNRVIEVEDPLGNSTFYEYDKNSNRVKKTDAAGNELTFTHDADNRLTGIDDPLGASHVFAYDSRGNLLTHTLPGGDSWIFTYNNLNQKVTETNPSSELYSYIYTTNGDPASITKPNGQVVTYTYDGLDRLIRTSDQNGTIYTTTYDDNSNVLTEEDGLGNTLINITYDAANRVVSETDGLGNAHQYLYDNTGNTIQFTDRNGQVSHFTYDGLNRKLSSTNPLGQSIQYTYDAVGNLASETDENGNVTSYAYDGLNRLVRETYPDASTRELTYDVLGNVATRTNNDGAVTTYTHDARGRLTLIDRPGSLDDSFTFDNQGRLTAASNPNAALVFTYDKMGRILTESLNSKVTTYAYDVANDEVTTTYPGGQSIIRTSDLRGQLSSLKEGANTLANYTYNGADRLGSRTYGNGTSTAYTYNGNFYITGIEHNGPGGLIAGFNSTYDNAGNKILEAFTHQVEHSEQYAYDANNQLRRFRRGSIFGSSISVGTEVQSINYDGSGNRIGDYQKSSGSFNTFTSNALNQYTAISNGGSTINPTYDLNGNQTSDGTNTFLFDDENRLTSINGGATATYAYDPLGRRVSKTVGASTTSYYYDGERVIEERDVSDAVIATYVYGESLDEPVMMRRGGTDYYYHSNTAGSVMAITDGSGTLVEQYEYDGFGRATLYDPSYGVRSTSAIGNPYLFTGRRLDEESGLYYYRARYYNASIGRFLSRDPLGSWDDVNLYKYAENDPQNIVDPMGTSGKYIHWTPSLKHPARWRVVGKSTEYRPAKTIRSYLMVNCCCIENSYDKVEEVTSIKKNREQVFFRLRPSWVKMRKRLRYELASVNGYIEAYNEEVELFEKATDENFGTKSKLKITASAIISDKAPPYIPASTVTDIAAGDDVSAESVVGDAGGATATYVAGPVGGFVWSITFGLGRTLKKAWALNNWKSELKEKKKKLDERIRKYKEMEKNLLRKSKWQKKTEVTATDEEVQVKCTKLRMNLSTKQVPLSKCK